MTWSMRRPPAWRMLARTRSMKLRYASSRSALRMERRQAPVLAGGIVDVGRARRRPRRPPRRAGCSRSRPRRDRRRRRGRDTGRSPCRRCRAAAAASASCPSARNCSQAWKVTRSAWSMRELAGRGAVGVLVFGRPRLPGRMGRVLAGEMLAQRLEQAGARQPGTLVHPEVTRNAADSVIAVREQCLQHLRASAARRRGIGHERRGAAGSKCRLEYVRGGDERLRRRAGRHSQAPRSHRCSARSAAGGWLASTVLACSGLSRNSACSGLSPITAAPRGASSFTSWRRSE